MVTSLPYVEFTVTWQFTLMGRMSSLCSSISGSKIGYFTDFKIAHMQIETLHFVTLKYKLIRIQLRDDVNVTIYDGPGILSKSCDISKKNSTFISSSFQCITKLHFGPKRSDMFHINIFYYTTWHNVSFGNQSHEYSINSSFYKSTIFIHKFLLNSDTNLYFNISVPYFLYKGDEMHNCLFGGITFFSVNLKELNELRTMCVTSNAHSRNLQNMYSNIKQILVVIYAYQGYSSLYVRLRLSFTNCLSTRINACISNPKWDAYWLFPTGPLKRVIYTYGPSGNINVILNEIKCIVVQLYKGQTKSTIRCSKRIRIEKSIGNPQTCQYHVTGYFSSDHHCKYKTTGFKWRW